VHGYYPVLYILPLTTYILCTDGRNIDIVKFEELENIARQRWRLY